MKISARNVIKGKVIQVTKDAVNAEVAIELPGSEQTTFITTNTSAENLGLVVGKDAYAVIKASNMMIAVDE